MATVTPHLWAGKMVMLGSTVVGWLGLLFRNWLADMLLMSARTSSGIGLFCRIDSRLPRKSMQLASAELNFKPRERMEVSVGLSCVVD